MDTVRFDRLTRAFSHLLSRRRLVGTLGLAAIGLPDPIAAKKKRKRKKEEPKLNAFGCVNVGQFCKNDEQCCSGICEGKREKRKCKAHGTGTCDQEGPGLCTAPNPELLTCNNSAECACIRTTAGSNFCYDQRSESGSDCAECQQDADCEALGFPPGTACAAVLAGRCAGACAGGMYCTVPCGYEPPAPE
jgi:hypothetical protein